MRYVMAAVTFVLTLAFLPGAGFPATLYVKHRPVQAQNAKKPTKK